MPWMGVEMDYATVLMLACEKETWMVDKMEREKAFVTGAMMV